MREEVDVTEAILRIAVADHDRRKVEAFTRSLTPLITAGPPGTTGYAEGRPRVHPLLRYWPCLIPSERVAPSVDVLNATTAGVGATPARPPASVTTSVPSTAPLSQRPIAAPAATSARSKTMRLSDIASARSGDKGTGANIGVIARAAQDYPRLLARLTAARVAAYFGVPVESVRRYELPNLMALNFLIGGILSNSLRTDAQGKSLGQQLLLIPLAELAGAPGATS